MTTIRVRHDQGKWRTDQAHGIGAARLSDLLDFVGALIAPDREHPHVAFVDGDCPIGTHGIQDLVSYRNWMDGEEELVVTRALESGFTYHFVYRFEYDRSSMTGHQVLSLFDAEQASWLSSTLKASIRPLRGL